MRAPTRQSPGFIAPCLPTNAQTAPTGPQWIYEIKHDGFGFICRRDGDRVRVFSRQGIDHTDRAPAIAEALMALRAKSIIIDGEGVVCSAAGVSDFEMLRAAVSRNGSRAGHHRNRRHASYLQTQPFAPWEFAGAAIVIAHANRMAS